VTPDSGPPPGEETEDERAVARVLAAIVADASRRRVGSAGRNAPAQFRLSELRGRLLRHRVFQDPAKLLTRLRRRGFLEEIPEGRSDRIYLIRAPGELRHALGIDAAGVERIAPVPDETAEVHAMDTAYFHALKDLLDHRLDATLQFGRELSIDRLATYLKDLFGEELYPDLLIALLQQYALSDVPLVAPTGRVTGSTGFHLALFGPPGTGKTFSIDDFIRGNPRRGVPAHGLPGRNRYCGGITPVQFLHVGAAYTGRTFNFIVPEFNDWFKYRGMVEPLKLVMEQREVKWETTWGTVGPYTFRSFFSVNYNVRTSGGSDYWTTISDPNFAALEDRMLLRFHPMTRARFRAVEESAERLELGEIDFELSPSLQDHLLLVHAIQAGHPLVLGRFPARPIRLDRTLYGRLREISEQGLARSAQPNFSPRLKSRAVQLAATAGLLAFFHGTTGATVELGPREVEFARRFYEAEIESRTGHRGHGG